ncbi:bifunctional dTDP-4-dehydrorhamnose 3,5-epimerase family protein/NAD(P)-dependent oxidoreductase [Brachybacterium sp. p3-SID1565]|uniref:bifunctional dTDP-4-dehydrorhamnose 3,5-epimerase family protein/NAD(P)-dependent oxidoreductase n=1 Tax=Brachybacterium sp. p3-SID1565 TaxID=2916046 RepID=UPI0021A8792D|nr:bifunctional dTDP-4-dehydrorhamnose 3,5-epimerase family protein/NAD(P)-dependent oxidoreductase [Brachybacterium sp. p3-SID1565]MCT1384730.1 bifunctional dTDP-4-dehydrorhamnose 3,5-epimerase family protein/NAD(P)-dependent oxidoreductase [Brachybacterium sp. p3-SID1565]
MTTKPLAVHSTPIPGLLVIDLPVHGDQRGWFKENWQRQKMVAAGLPDFGPVQNNISFNQAVGVTRGIHAEPWDKYISVATGRVFGAWVDLREGPTFGATYHHEITPDTAIFVPRGVGNAFQTLEAPAAYTYLVSAHWSEAAQAQYTFLNLADETAAIPWPIPLEQAELSEKDKAHPRLSEVTPVPPRRTLVVGAGGQLGRALAERWQGRADVDAVDRNELDIADAASVAAFDFSPYAVIVNAAAHTAVDAAETPEGRREAWAVNVTGVGRLVEAARRERATLVHVSSDYVFDGERELHDEAEPLSPLGVYGQTKAAGDQLVATVPDHYIVRTSWVIGEGTNFVRTMAQLAERGIDPTVVDDQIGRLTFTSDLAAAIDHLLTQRPQPGVYNLSGGGESLSWAHIAAEVFALTGHDRARVHPVSTGAYYAAQGKAEGDGTVAPRPRNSTLDLAKIEAAGFEVRDHRQVLGEYLQRG